MYGFKLQAATRDWTVAEYAPPQYATLAYWLFWAESNWEEADIRRALCTLCLFASKQGVNL